MNFVTQAEVVDIIKHKQDLNEYTLKLDKERKYLPGAFVQLTLDTVTASDIWPESRTFSIASYKKGSMRFIIKNAGLYTNRIFNELKLGTRCTIKYPFGELFDKNAIDEQHIFIAGGVGVTPFIGLIEYFNQLNQLENVSLFYSVRCEGDMLHFTELKDHLKERLYVYITRQKNEHYVNRRMKIDDFKQAFPNSDNVNYYICGSKAFNQDIKRELISIGYTKIHMDEWE